MGEGGSPVRAVADRGQRVAADLIQLAGIREDQAIEGHGEQDRTERRQQAAGPPRPKASESDRAVPGRFGEEERRDQETREHEKEVDAQVAADEVPAVEHENADDGQSSQAIQSRNVPDGRLRCNVAGGPPPRRAHIRPDDISPPNPLERRDRTTSDGRQRPDARPLSVA